MLAVARDMTDPEAKWEVIQIAVVYRRLAQRADKSVGKHAVQPSGRWTVDGVNR
jgi:hypothetical protein